MRMASKIISYDEEARRALERGINWIDTAAVYGLGHSEELVARALKGASERPYVFTKCSLVWDESGEVHNLLKKDSVKRECEESRPKGGPAECPHG
jgi:aryl-alcohol dehydrogenase-like predicted oxidoreductase